MIGLHSWDGLKLEVLFCNPFPLFTMAATMGAPKNRYYAAEGDANEEDDEAKPRNVARKK
jgi:hypothetical protein